MEELEADDALGIYATANPGNCVVSPDKDLRQIPGLLYDLKMILSQSRLKKVTMALCSDTCGRPN